MSRLSNIADQMLGLEEGEALKGHTGANERRPNTFEQASSFVINNARFNFEGVFGRNGATEEEDVLEQ